MPSAADVDHLAGHPDDVVAAGLERLLLAARASAIWPLGSRSEGFGIRAVGLVVETEVRHEAVVERRMMHLLQELHVLCSRLDDGLGGLDGVVGVADLHGVEGEGGSKRRKACSRREGRPTPARELRRVERVGRAVLGEDRLVTALHAPDAAWGWRTSRRGSRTRRSSRTGILPLAAAASEPATRSRAQLVGRHLDGRGVAHARDDRAHGRLTFHWPSAARPTRGHR